jgi:hypothetical protein
MRSTPLERPYPRPHRVEPAAMDADLLRARHGRHVANQWFATNLTVRKLRWRNECARAMSQQAPSP